MPKQPHPELNFHRGKGQRSRPGDLLKALDALGLDDKEKRELLEKMRRPAPSKDNGE